MARFARYATLPTEADVEKAVRQFIAGYTRIPASAIKLSWTLKGRQLSFDDNRLGYLAMTLRGYVKSFNESDTVEARELKKSEFTVAQTCKLVYERVTS